VKQFEIAYNTLLYNIYTTVLKNVKRDVIDRESEWKTRVGWQ